MKKHHKILTSITLWIFIVLPAIAEAEERIEMDGMSVIGNSELPKSLIIVPWKESTIEAMPDRPVNSLIEEALQPVDPEVFRRKIRYFDIVRAND